MKNKTKNKYEKLILILFLVLIFHTFFFTLKANEAKIPHEFNHISIANGLIHNGVCDVLKGPNGYIWIATYDGIQKYDGKNFKTYKNTNEKQLLPSNRVRKLAISPDNNLWIGTDKGVAKYNQEVDTFALLPQLGLSRLAGFPKKVRNIISLKEKELMICSIEDGGEIWQYDLKGKPLVIHKLVEHSALMKTYQGKILTKNLILWSTSEGLILYNVNSGKSKILTTPGEPVYNILKITDIKWLISFSSGIKILEISDNSISIPNYLSEISSIKSKEASKYLLPNDQIRTLYSNKKTIWLGTFHNGVIIIDKKKLLKGSISTLSHILYNHRISSFYNYDSTYIWISSFDNGLYQMSYQAIAFEKPQDKNVKDFINQNRLTQISPWHLNSVFLGNTIGNFILYNTKTKKEEPKPEIFQKIKNITSLYRDDKNGILWIQDKRNLYKYNEKTKEIKKYLIPKKYEKFTFHYSSQDTSYYSLKSSKNYIWLVSSNNICRLTIDSKTNKFKIELMTTNPLFDIRVTSRIRSTHFDTKNKRLWIGTDSQGAYVIDIVDNKNLRDLTVKHISRNNKTELTSNFVSSIQGNDSLGWWLGTEQGGLCQIDFSKGTIKKNFQEKDGLCNNVIKCMQIDRKHRVWIGTNIGLSCYDIKNNNFLNYNFNDELPFLDFQYESCTLGNGKIVMSGGNKICVFSPEKLPKKTKSPTFQFGDLTLLNKKVKIGEKIDNRIILNKCLGFQKELNLKHNENILSINIHILDFTTEQDAKVRYQLLPLTKEWVQLAVGQETISLSGLNSNKYKLRVQIADSKGILSEIKSLDINIQKAPWFTWWAWCIYIIFFTVLIFACINFILRVQQLNFKVEQEKIELKRAKELNEEKSRYFTNISHELKTPLTLISAPIQLLLIQFKNSKSLTQKLNVVERQSKKMLQLIDMAHGEQLDKANLLVRDDSIFMMNRFVIEVLQDFFVTAQVEEKSLILEEPEEHIFVQADHSQIETIINNLLNNAFKHTLRGDTITFKYYKTNDNNIIFSIKDTGQGIPSIALPHIFERFYQVHNKETSHLGGSGIGLTFSKKLVELHKGTIDVKSTEGQGSTFTVNLPIIRLEIDEEVIENEEKELIDIKKVIQSEITSNDENNAKINISDTYASSLSINNYNLNDLDVNKNLKKKLVYLVEDNAYMRSFVYDVLSIAFSVESFSDAPSCLEKIKKTWPDVIVSDVMMPQMDGYEFCNQVKSNAKTSHIPVILLTACGSLEERVKGVDQGADAYIAKPFQPKFLIKRIASILETREKLEERYKSELPLTMQEESKEKKYMDFLERLYKLLDESLNKEDIDFSRMALELGMNRTNFYQKVKDATGKTPFEILKKHRIKRAAEYLLEGESVANAGYRSGFKSRTHFTKIFKETYGVTPSKYANYINSKITE